MTLDKVSELCDNIIEGYNNKNGKAMLASKLLLFDAIKKGECPALDLEVVTKLEKVYTIMDSLS